ncbi:MAG: phospholipase D family protein [Methanosarcinales archaeon Met12]|nr:MAG: phospholipase D family protein [Methanosarcinales archaeon Met12]
MVEFLNSSAISYHLENLIKNAGVSLFLISPYLKFNSRIKQILDEKNRLRLDIRIIYGKADLQTEESKWLKSMDSIKVLFCKNLHAKCYINEKEAIITSMNLYDFSQQNNIEMGIYITKENDPKLYQDVHGEVTSLIRTSEHVSISIEKVETKKKGLDKTTPNEKQLKNRNGHCIRCDADITLNPNYPLCKKCYTIWKEYSDPTYKEKFCHMCGKSNSSSMEKPVCYSCYKLLL